MLALSGELDLVGADHVRGALARTEGDATEILVMDLAGLTFMDSTGLGIALDAAARAERRGARLVVARPQPPVERVFRIAGVTHLLAGGDEIADLLPS